MKKYLLLFTCLLSLLAMPQHYPDSQKDGRFVTVNGARLWVVTVGQGDPLILIAGGPGGAHLGLRRFDTLAQHYMLIYFDAFGRGKSDTAKNLREYTIERDIEDIEGLRTALHLDKV
ncbi:MAG: alpha/beta fold hydrolase, partial [Flavisolibacter sp.]